MNNKNGVHPCIDVAARERREKQARELGYYEPSDEEKREILAKNIALLSLARGGIDERL
jgi:hypothetical protein